MIARRSEVIGQKRGTNYGEKNHKMQGEEPETMRGRDQVQAGGCLTSAGGVPEGGRGFGETLV